MNNVQRPPYLNLQIIISAIMSLAGNKTKIMRSLKIPFKIQKCKWENMFLYFPLHLLNGYFLNVYSRGLFLSFLDPVRWISQRQISQDYIKEKFLYVNCHNSFFI